MVASRLDFQPSCEASFLAPHHGWITGLTIVFLTNHSQACAIAFPVIGQFCHLSI